MNPAHTLDIEIPINETTTHALTPSDEDLMCAIQGRDSRALETLLERHGGLLKSVILRIVHSHSCADDVLQDCLVAIWNYAQGYSAAKGRPLGWMVTLAKRRALDHLRREISYGGAKDRLEAEIRHFTFAEGSSCEDADMARVMDVHINLLPEKQQEVIRLAFLDGMSQREVAAATRTPLGTVKTRIELGLSRLRVTCARQKMCQNS